MADSNEFGPQGAPRLAGLGLLFVLGAAGLLAIDLPLARFCLADRIPGELRIIIRLSEVMAHGYGAGAILLGLYWLAGWTRRRLLWAAALVYTPGLFVHLGKILVLRRRPIAYADEFPDHPLQTVELVLPWVFDDVPFGWTVYTVQSFPSGHAATAIGLSIALIWIYPRGRWYFATLAALACVQRVDSGAHFPSDTLAGAAIACFSGAVLLRVAHLAVWHRFAAALSRALTRLLPAGTPSSGVAERT